MKRTLSSIVWTLFLCLSAGGGDLTLSVAAASDLQRVLPELNKAFSKTNPGVEVKASFGSSGNFYTQLCGKAPFDVFLSADGEYPKKLAEKGLARKETLFKYGVGRIVLWAPKGSKLDIAGQGAKALLDPSVIKVAIANPAHAPYGRAAEAALKSLGVYDGVKAKLVLGENISQTAQYVQSRAADVGVIAKSLTFGPALSDGMSWEFPPDSYPPLEQAGAILSWARSPEAAEAYRAFLIGEEGRAIFKAYGFSMPETKEEN